MTSKRRAVIAFWTHPKRRHKLHGFRGETIMNVGRRTNKTNKKTKTGDGVTIEKKGP